MTRLRTLIVIVALFAMSLGGSLALLAQDQLNLGDGIVNNMFRGGGSNQITLLLEPQNCSGGICYLATGVASGTGDLAGNGTYTITTASVDCSTSPPVGCAGPFSLQLNANGDSIVMQTSPIQFAYTSSQGTLTGLIQFNTVSKSNPHIYSTALGALTVTGGTFAQYFPGGGNVNISFGLTFPLQYFSQTHHAFATLDFQAGTVVPNPSPLALTCSSAAAQIGVPYSSALVASGGVP